MKIEKATLENLETLIDIWKRSKYLPTTAAKMKETLIKSLRYSDIYIVYEKSKALSYFVITNKKKVTYLNMIVLIKDSQGKGLGKKIMKEIVELSEKNKSEVVQLAVFAKNLPAIVLYSKHGFYFIGFRKKTDKKLGRKLVMEKTL